MKQKKHKPSKKDATVKAEIQHFIPFEPISDDEPVAAVWEEDELNSDWIKLSNPEATAHDREISRTVFNQTKSKS